jgi:hypothetical protein
MGRLFGTMRGGLAISVTLVGALLGARPGVVGATGGDDGADRPARDDAHRYEPASPPAPSAPPARWGRSSRPHCHDCAGRGAGLSLPAGAAGPGLFSIDTISVGDLYAGALIPSLVLTAMYMIYQAGAVLVAARDRPRRPPDEAGT